MPAKALVSDTHLPESSPLLVLSHTSWLEFEREKLYCYVRDFGILSPKTLRQSQRVDKLIFSQMNNTVTINR